MSVPRLRVTLRGLQWTQFFLGLFVHSLFSHRLTNSNQIQHGNLYGDGHVCVVPLQGDGFQCTQIFGTTYNYYRTV